MTTSATIIRKSTAVRIPVLLLDASGAGKTGILPANIQSSEARIYKADGTISFMALTGANWIEVDSANAPGFYQCLLTTTETNVLGPMQVIFRPVSSAFEQAWAQVTVEDLAMLATISTSTAATNTTVGTINTNVTTVNTTVNTINTTVNSISTALTTVGNNVLNLIVSVGALVKLGLNRMKIHTSGGDANRLVIYEADGTTVAYRFTLKDASGNPTTESPFERLPLP